MRRLQTVYRKLLAVVFIAATIGPLPTVPVQAQRRAIIVNADQPNVWTLEQAHYLLAQMHRRNLDLKATGLGDLDPNEINGLHFDVLRTLLEFGVAFDEAARFNNSLLKTKKGFDADRAIKLQKRRDELADESLKLNRDIARIGREQALADEKAEKEKLGAQIEELKVVKDGVDKEVARLDADIKAAGGPTGDVQATEAEANFDPNKLPKSIFDDASKEIFKKLIDRFNEAPKLNATIRLDNFLQMQYEIIAKQLTLLRDEVGPGERIIFLELPQTVNASHDKANKMWAQSWWKIVGYTNPRLSKSVLSTMQVDEEPQRETREIIDDALAAYAGTRTSGNGICERQAPNASVSFRELDCSRVTSIPGDVAPDDRSVRTIELIPRQSSLNINDIKLRARSGVLTAVAKTLFGFGARLNFQRQRETFSQFVQQELYSSMFGKGAREFGWTFNPMPGTDRVMSGVRTTYAVMVVPAKAEALILQTRGCAFPRSAHQPESFSDNEGQRCNNPRSFVVPIPGGGNAGDSNFWVGGMEYTPAKKNDSIAVIIYGKNFTPQVGLLVDGVPLTASIGLAQPLIRDDSSAARDAALDLKSATIQGHIERVSPTQIVAVFRRMDGKEGTPILTMIAPGKVKHLNSLRLYINGQLNRKLEDEPWMFGKKPADKEAFRIDSVAVFSDRSSPKQLVAVINGAGFQGADKHPKIYAVMANGHVVDDEQWSLKSSTLVTLRFPIPPDEKIRIALVSQDDDPTKRETCESDPVDNPRWLNITRVSVITYEEGSETEAGTLVVKIEGAGFSKDLKAFVDNKAVEMAVKSATEAFLKISDPKAAAVLILRDAQTGMEAKTIITRKSASPK